MGNNAEQTRSLAAGIHNAHNDWWSRIELRSDIRPDPNAAAITKEAETPCAPETRIRRLAKS